MYDENQKILGNINITTRTKDITSSKVTVHNLLQLQMCHTLTFTNRNIIYATKITSLYCKTVY